MAMSGGHIALIIFIIIIVLVLIVIVILAATGVFAAKTAQGDIKGVFSLEHEATKKYFTAGLQIGTSGSYSLIASSTATIPCANYTWEYKTYTSTIAPIVTVNNALVWGGKNLIATAASATVGAIVTLSVPTSNSTLSSWTFKDDTRWCLSSNPSLCLFYNSSTNQTTLQTFSTSTILKGGFIIPVRKPITPPKCT